MLAGNEKKQEYLNSLVVNRTLVHAYIFIGPKGVGKTGIALDFARKILCEKEGTDDCDCPQCRLASKGNHPDLLFSDDEELLSIEKAREMISFLDLKPYQAQNKTLLIAHGERMTIAAANSLLKTLEEPSANTTIIITAENLKNLLPTIVSRAQIIKFSALNKDEIIGILHEKTGDVRTIEDIINITGGQVGLAIKFIENPEQFEKMMEIVRVFEQLIYTKDIYEKMVFAEKLAKDKENVYLYLDCLESFFREKLKQTGQSPLMICRILDKLSEVKGLTMKNINIQLALESLMLVGENNA
jgi:DNA polymerase-3 subunit delta'